MNNGINFYPSPYGPAPYSGLPNNYGITSPPIPHYYNSPYLHPRPKSEPQKAPPSQQQQQQQQQYQPPPQQQQQQLQPQQQKSSQNQQRPISQQTNENNNSFKLYDLITSTQSDIIRLIFAFVGVSYKDKHLKSEDWMHIKEQIPFQQLPILRVNNQFRIFHLHAIVRYLAREFHLYGTGKHDHAIVDIVTEIARQLQEKISERTDSSASTEDQTLQQSIVELASNYLKQFEELYTVFDRHGPFYLGSHISLADLIVYSTINYLISIDTNLLENYTHLKEARRQLQKHPGIANFNKSKETESDKHQRHKSPHVYRRRTNSPTPHTSSHRQHHRHRSDERHKSKHHHHHHYHCQYHRRQNSKEPTPLSHSKHHSEKSSKSPSVLTNEKDSVPPVPSVQASVPTCIPPAPPVPPALIKQQVVRASRSPSSSRKDKETTPLSNPKQRLIRSSISPSIVQAEKGSAPTTAATTTVIPPPPPILKEQKAASKAK
ncbi:hypothetical protein I4U23_008374 [Adineta vaga]|nr:hypothetical protein I4U23_008374 [Adineta vaga]